MGHDPIGKQRPENADMGKSARRATTQGKSDHRPSNAAKSDFSVAIRSAMAAPDQIFQHRASP
jgi:hypothetical protein